MFALLADHFLREFTTAYGRKPKELTEEALRVLEEYPWPGNVRELRNLMERIVIMNPQARIDARHIPLDRARRAVFDRPMERFGSLQEVREAAERDYILKKLEEAKGNVTRAAEDAGAGAQPSVPQDEGAGHRAQGIDREDGEETSGRRHGPVPK